ncbi:hypothetical protein [Chitinophaga nivalis]|uniref:Lipoprotein n=1 Tax=Chitinophaga nivalis TaxID=2991709 RepID=A0ABT3INL2_9BACT|nr:hypothetical protein [Chitinophaga nivalis]MCW3465004.1 hypothetical protein [Chitinophaga nivalis]MCW3485304.1 hypothetical protein [Chitinophaga nivalis]
MKRSPFFFAVLLMLAMIAGCKQQVADHTTTTPVVNSNDCGQATDSVTRILTRLTTARENILAYDKLNRKHWKHREPVEAYTIRAVDLLTAMGMPASMADSAICRFKHVRVYLGYHEQAGFKLYVVPVDNACLKGSDPRKWNAGTDVMLDKQANPIMESISPSGMANYDRYVLDLNAPCPNTCPNGNTVKEDRQP